MTDADRLAEIVKYSAHSFRVIRAHTSLKLTDSEFSVLVCANFHRFSPVRFAKKNEFGERMKPGRPGVKLNPLGDLTDCTTDTRPLRGLPSARNPCG